jgi:peptidoglycan/xylan/chitin deacetylase (PgdA/CDA1 family)
VRVVSLAYHDVAAAQARDATGFRGSGPDRYKLAPEQFAAHLATLEGLGVTPATAPQFADRAVALTFDDGGASATEVVAPLLAERGWHGHFFVTTGRIGSSGFVTAEQIADLYRAGNVVGSHSHTHRILTRLADEEIADEWRRSKKTLEDILGVEVDTLSVPTGYYGERIGRIAAELGFRHLFTSEPWVRPRRLRDALVYGRFAVISTTSSAHVAELCRLSRRAMWRDAGSWYARKVAKTALGDRYAALRRTLLARRAS